MQKLLNQFSQNVVESENNPNGGGKKLNQCSKVEHITTLYNKYAN